jgi:hypothetical protein
MMIKKLIIVRWPRLALATLAVSCNEALRTKCGGRNTATATPTTATGTEGGAPAQGGCGGRTHRRARPV